MGNTRKVCKKLRFVAFPATEYDEVFSGYQLGQMVWLSGEKTTQPFDLADSLRKLHRCKKLLHLIQVWESISFFFCYAEQKCKSQV